MGNYAEAAAVAVLIAALLYGATSTGQTPEQEKSWAADRASAAAVQKAALEKLARERAARRANPMAWVATLDPMSAGGWVFRAVANDGSWAAFSSTHQLKRAGPVVTVWQRLEYAEPQIRDSGPYASVVEKAQYDCKKEQARDLLVIYYSANNIQSAEQTEEADAKNNPWHAIVPGTREELNFLWACDQARGSVTK